MLRYSFLFFSLFLLIGSSGLYSQDFVYKQFTSNDGLPSNTCYQSLMDKDGYMWFATEYGVSRFDGFHFENFDQNKGLSDNDVFKLFQDSKGRIWFLLSNGQLNFYLDQKIYNPSNTPFLSELKSSIHFNGVCEDKRGTLWFTTQNNGIFLLNTRNEVEHLQALIDLPCKLIVPGIWQDKESQIWIASEKGLINLSVNSGVVAIPYSFPNFNQEYVYKLKEGGVLISVGGALYFLSDIAKSFQPFSKTGSKFNKFVTKIFQDQCDNVWVSSLEGLYQIADHSGSFTKSKGYLKDHFIADTYEDKFGNFWISTLNEGIFLINQPDLRQYTKSKLGIKSPVTYLSEYGNKIWYGTDEGQFGLISADSVEPFDLKGSNNFNGRGRVKELKYWPGRKQWWLITESGIGFMEGKVVSPLYFTGGKSIEIDSLNDRIWYGTSTQLNWVHASKLSDFLRKEMAYPASGFNEKLNRAKAFAEKENKTGIIPSTRIYKLKQSHRGTLWVAANMGLFSIEPGDRVVSWRTRSPELGIPYQDLVVFSDETVVASSSGWGMALIPRGQNFQERIFEPFNSLYIRKLKRIGQDSLLVCSQAGLDLFAWRKDESKLEHLAFFGKSCLIDPDVHNVGKLGNCLYVGSSSGVIAYPDFFARHNVFKQVFPKVKGVYNDGQFFKAGAGVLKLQNGKQLIRIEFENLNFKSLGRSHYRYRLQKNTLWQSFEGGSLVFNQLNSGDFELELEALVNGKSWSDPNLALVFSIPEPWYLKAFPLFVIAFFIFGIVGFVAFQYWFVPSIRIPYQAQQFHHNRKMESLGLLLYRAHLSHSQLISRSDLEKLQLLQLKIRKLSVALIKAQMLPQQDLKTEMEWIEVLLEMHKTAFPNFNYQIFYSKADMDKLPVPQFLLLQLVETFLVELEKSDADKSEMTFRIFYINEGLEGEIRYQTSQIISKKEYSRFSNQIERLEAEFQNLSDPSGKKVEIKKVDIENESESGILIRFWISSELKIGWFRSPWFFRGLDI